MLVKNQIKKYKKKKQYRGVKQLEKNPQKKGLVLRVVILSPRKPNSAKRKAVRVALSNGQKIYASIPGEGHSLQKFSVILIRGGRIRDLPGIRCRAIRGKYDLLPSKRHTARSKYGIKKAMRFDF